VLSTPPARMATSGFSQAIQAPETAFIEIPGRD
jgi:hypothetical protein